MLLPLSAVVKQLEDSGIISAETLEPFVPPAAQPHDADELIAALVRDKHLTDYQAREIAAGRGDGLVVAGFTILERIGSGGMGQVYRALHRRMKRVVAIKMLPAATMGDSVVVSRFLREVEAAARLRHPNIVAADDADEARGVHFLVMEYVDGQDLSTLVKRTGTLSIDDAVNYVLQAARGLEYAHDQGVVHRDIKPANLLVDKQGTVKILDLGLASVRTGDAAARQAELTDPGTIMGTIDYMAPEQAASTKHADARADIYSLGCTFFYLLTRRPVYDGDSVAARLLAHREASIPSLFELRPGVPDEVEAVFRKMVAKRVGERYRSMREVIAALEKTRRRPDTYRDTPTLLEGARGRETASEGTARRRGLLPAVACLGMALIVAGVVWLRNTGEPDLRQAQTRDLRQTETEEAVTTGVPARLSIADDSSSPNVDLLLIGDATMEHWKTMGKAAWERNFAERTSQNLAAAGNQIGSFARIITTDEYADVRPRIVVLQVGLNNLLREADAIDKHLAQYPRALAALRTRFPTSFFLLVSVIPQHNHADEIRRLNAAIESLSDRRTTFFVDLTGSLLDPAGKPDSHVISNETLTPLGYSTYAARLRPFVDRLLEAPQ